MLGDEFHEISLKKSQNRKYLNTKNEVNSSKQIVK